MLGEILTVYGVPKKEISERVMETLKEVGLEPHHIYRYPHEFSGGQRQRIAIARALIPRPKLLIADEPSIMLDMSVKAAILNLMKNLQKRLNITYLYISNDLGEIRYISDRAAMIHLGKIVEHAPTKELLDKPMHPYTQNLLRILPLPDPDIKPPQPLLKEETSSRSLKVRTGCLLTERCPHATEKCRTEEPELTEVSPGHYVACYMTG